MCLGMHLLTMGRLLQGLRATNILLTQTCSGGTSFLSSIICMIFEEFVVSVLGPLARCLQAVLFICCRALLSMVMTCGGCCAGWNPAAAIAAVGSTLWIRAGLLANYELHGLLPNAAPIFSS